MWGKKADLWSTSDSQQQLFLLSQIVRGTDGDRFFDLGSFGVEIFYCPTKYPRLCVKQKITLNYAYQEECLSSLKL